MDNKKSIFSLDEDVLEDRLLKRLNSLQQNFDELLRTIFEDERNMPNTEIFISIISREGELSVYRDDKVYQLDINNLLVHMNGYISEELCKKFDIKISELYIFPLYEKKHIDFNIMIVSIVTEGYDEFIFLKHFYERFCFEAENLLMYANYNPFLDINKIVDNGIFFIRSESFQNMAKKNISCLPDFVLITRLSALLYENQKCEANIICVMNDICMAIKFEEPVELSYKNFRQIRKLLEMSKFDMCLVLKCIWNNEIINPKFEIVGIAKRKRIKHDIVFEISGHMEWKLYYDEKPALKYQEGRYLILNEKDFKYDQVNSIATRIFKVDRKESEKIIKIVESSLCQEHGTTLIFAQDAKVEAERLYNVKRGIKIEKLDLSIDLDIIKNITSIDGAVMIDENSFCYGIGVILDGNALVKGSAARGARYNSAYNYIAGKKKDKMKYIAIVLSEDKTIDIITTEDDFEYV